MRTTQDQGAEAPKNRSVHKVREDFLDTATQRLRCAAGYIKVFARVVELVAQAGKLVPNGTRQTARETANLYDERLVATLALPQRFLKI